MKISRASQKIATQGPWISYRKAMKEARAASDNDEDVIVTFDFIDIRRDEKNKKTALILVPEEATGDEVSESAVVHVWDEPVDGVEVDTPDGVRLWNAIDRFLIDNGDEITGDDVDASVLLNAMKGFLPRVFRLTIELTKMRNSPHKAWLWTVAEVDSN